MAKLQSLFDISIRQLRKTLTPQFFAKLPYDIKNKVLEGMEREEQLQFWYENKNDPDISEILIEFLLQDGHWSDKDKFISNIINQLLKGFLLSASQVDLWLDALTQITRDIKSSNELRLLSFAAQLIIMQRHEFDKNKYNFELVKNQLILIGQSHPELTRMILNRLSSDDEIEINIEEIKRQYISTNPPDDDFIQVLYPFMGDKTRAKFMLVFQEILLTPGAFRGNGFHSLILFLTPKEQLQLLPTLFEWLKSSSQDVRKIAKKGCEIIALLLKDSKEKNLLVHTTLLTFLADLKKYHAVGEGEHPFRTYDVEEDACLALMPLLDKNDLFLFLQTICEKLASTNFIAMLWAREACLQMIDFLTENERIVLKNYFLINLKNKLSGEQSESDTAQFLFSLIVHLSISLNQTNPDRKLPPWLIDKINDFPNIKINSTYDFDLKKLLPQLLSEDEFLGLIRRRLGLNNKGQFTEANLEACYDMTFCLDKLSKDEQQYLIDISLSILKNKSDSIHKFNAQHILATLIPLRKNDLSQDVYHFFVSVLHKAMTNANQANNSFISVFDECLPFLTILNQDDADKLLFIVLEMQNKYFQSYDSRERYNYYKFIKSLWDKISDPGRSKLRASYIEALNSTDREVRRLMFDHLYDQDGFNIFKDDWLEIVIKLFDIAVEGTYGYSPDHFIMGIANLLSKSEYKKLILRLSKEFTSPSLAREEHAIFICIALLEVGIRDELIDSAERNDLIEMIVSPALNHLRDLNSNQRGHLDWISSLACWIKKDSNDYKLIISFILKVLDSTDPYICHAALNVIRSLRDYMNDEVRMKVKSVLMKISQKNLIIQDTSLRKYIISDAFLSLDPAEWKDLIRKILEEAKKFNNYSNYSALKFFYINFVGYLDDAECSKALKLILGTSVIDKFQFNIPHSIAQPVFSAVITPPLTLNSEEVLLESMVSDPTFIAHAPQHTLVGYLSAFVERAVINYEKWWNGANFFKRRDHKLRIENAKNMFTRLQADKNGFVLGLFFRNELRNRETDKIIPGICSVRNHSFISFLLNELKTEPILANYFFKNRFQLRPEADYTQASFMKIREDALALIKN